MRLPKSAFRDEVWRVLRRALLQVVRAKGTVFGTCGDHLLDEFLVAIPEKELHLLSEIRIVYTLVSEQWVLPHLNTVEILSETSVRMKYFQTRFCGFKGYFAITIVHCLSHMINCKVDLHIFSKIFECP